MEHLDDFIREQFRQDDPAGRFHFRKEYWEQALSLIEADERKRRRGLLWWWLTGFLLLAGLGWWGWQCSHTALPRTMTADLEKKTASHTTSSSRLPAKDLAGDAVNTTNIPTHNANTVAVSPQQKSGTARAEKPAATYPAAPKNFYPGNFQERFSAKTGTQNPVIPRELTDFSQVPGNKDSGSLTQPNSANTTATNAENLSRTTNGTMPLASGTVNTSTINLSGAKMPGQILVSLPAEFQLLSSGLTNFQPAQAPATSSPIQPARETKLALGINASTSVYTSALPKRKLGATAGIYAAYWLRPAWSVSAGLDLRSQPANNFIADSLTVSSYQLHYRFGYEETSYSRNDRSLYFYEIPLGLHWHYRTWQLETGVRFGHLFAGRTVQTQTSRSSLQPDPGVEKRPVQMDLSAYRRNYTGYFAGIGWQPIPRLQLEVRGTYRPASVLKPNGEHASPAGGFWLDAGLRWQLFNSPRNRVKR